MSFVDLIYAVAPWVALGIVIANWRPICWLVKTLAAGMEGRKP